MINNLSKALLEAQKNMGDATKSSKNSYFKEHSYADLNSIRETVTPALNAQGITILQPTVVELGKNYVETILLHESGEFISGLTEIKNADGKPQSEGSGISYARRYGLQSMLNVGAVDDDGEAAQGRTVKKETKNEQSNTQAKPAAQSVATKTPTDPTPATPAKAVASPAVPQPTSLPSESATPLADTKILRQKIKSAFAVLEAQKKVSKTEFTTNYLGGGKVDTVSNEQVNKAITMLKTNFKELGL